VAPSLIAARRDPVDVDKAEAREYLAEVEVAADSPMVGRGVEQAGLRNLPGLFLVEIHRHGSTRSIRPVAPEDRIKAGDHLVFTGDAESITDVAQMPGLDAVDSKGVPAWRRTFEVVISPGSSLVGLTVRDAEFRRRFGAAILAAHRAGERISGRIGDIVLRPGDTLMISATPGFRKTWQDSSMFLLVSERSEDERPRYRKAPLALLAIAGMVLVPAFTQISLLVSGMGALFFLLATGCISGRAARLSISWSVLVLIASAIGVAAALEKSGAAEVLGETLLAITQPLGPLGLLAGIWVLGALFASFVSNAAGAALVFPVAMTAATSAGLDTHTVALALALATSAGFSTPIGSNPNLLVFGPGGCPSRSSAWSAPWRCCLWCSGSDDGAWAYQPRTGSQRSRTSRPLTAW
jgi:di/tricarboxylate transporter